MAKKTSKKKVVSTKKAPKVVKKALSPTSSSRSKSVSKSNTEPLLFGKRNYMFLFGGAIAMALGFILMLGGNMPDPNTWDENIIYGTRRIVIAPFLILSGLVAMVFAIFIKNNTVSIDSSTANKERVINKNM